MDHHTVNQSIRCGIFLGSIDRIALGGNDPSASIQIQYALYPNGVDGIKQLSAVAEYQNPSEHFFDLELCGVPRLATTYITAAMNHRHTGEGRVSMFKLSTGMNTAELSSSSNDTTTCVYQHPFPITSLSFQPETELLAVGSESGEVVLIDLYSNREVSRFKVDPAGVNEVLFLRNGSLATVGDSTKSQIKIWDIRNTVGSTTNETQQQQSVMTLQQQLSGNYRSITMLDSPPKTRSNPRFKCLTAHAVQEKIISGMANGSVMLWDLRSEASIEFAPHTSAVSDVKMHPFKQDIVFSASTDGTVRCFDSSNLRTASVHHQMQQQPSPLQRPTIFGSGPYSPTSTTASTSALSLQQYTEETNNNSVAGEKDFPVLLSEPATITSLDFDLDSSTMLAVSEIGSVWRVPV